MNRQVLELWNRYKPTIAVDAIEYDRELKKLLGTNLAEVGTDCISREQAIDAFNTNIDELVVAGKENADAVERYLNRVIDEIAESTTKNSALTKTTTSHTKTMHAH